MWNPPTDAELQKLPPVGHYSKASLPDITIHQHYFLGSADWWVAEYDSNDRLFYGYVCLNDPINAEWGYSSLDEMLALKVSPLDTEAAFEIDRDLYWKPCAVPEVEGIVACYKAQGLNSLVQRY